MDEKMRILRMVEQGTVTARIRSAINTSEPFSTLTIKRFFPT